MSIADAIKDVQNGNVDRFETLYTEYRPRLERWLRVTYRWMQREMVETVAHDALAYAWERIGRFDPARADFFTWLCWQAKDRAARVRRSQFRSECVSLEEIGDILDEVSPTLEERHFRKMRADRLMQLVNELPLRQRFCVILRCIKHRSRRYTAGRLGLTLSQVDYAVRLGTEALNEARRRTGYDRA